MTQNTRFIQHAEGGLRFDAGGDEIDWLQNALRSDQISAPHNGEPAMIGLYGEGRVPLHPGDRIVVVREPDVVGVVRAV